jgi:GNAT superfamily N-acetyltransferase
MTTLKDNFKIIDVTADNISETGIYCIKDKKSAGYRSKVEWFKSNTENGLKIKIATDYLGKQLGFIEYMPSEFAWRPIKAENYLFIQCILIFLNEAKDKGLGSRLLQICEEDAKKLNKSGICALSSEGAWLANKSLFEKNGFIIGDSLGRFELMVKSFESRTSTPCIIDWTKQKTKYKGWNLIYSDQCPWHEKSVTDLKQLAFDKGITLKVTLLTSPTEAQNAPSGFGTFSLIKDGKLLEDHYLSKKRFENIIKQEINNILKDRQ